MARDRMKNHVYLTEKGREALSSCSAIACRPMIADKIAAAAAPAFRERVSLQLNRCTRCMKLPSRNEYKLSLTLTMAEGDLTGYDTHPHV